MLKKSSKQEEKQRLEYEHNQYSNTLMEKQKRTEEMEKEKLYCSTL